MPVSQDSLVMVPKSNNPKLFVPDFFNDLYMKKSLIGYKVYLSSQQIGILDAYQEIFRCPEDRISLLHHKIWHVQLLPGFLHIFRKLGLQNFVKERLIPYY